MAEENEYLFKILFQQEGEQAVGNTGNAAEKTTQKLHGTKEAAVDLNESFKGLMETAVAAAGIFEGFSFMGESHDYYIKLQTAQAEIQASLKSTANAAGETTESLATSADALFHHSTYAKDNIEKMQSVLLSMPGITSKTFDSTSQAIIDMAAKTQGANADLAGSATQLGKALSDPEHEVTRLKISMPALTDAVVENVEALAKHGNILGAQKAILAAVQQSYGGSAQAALDAGGATGTDG